MAGPGSCATGAAACIAADHALAFALGRLAPDERAQVEHRIAACAACRAVVAEANRRVGGELAHARAGGGDGRTAVQRGRAHPPSPAARVEPVTQTLPQRPDLRPAAQAEEVIELVGGRPGATIQDRPGAQSRAAEGGRAPRPPVDTALAPGDVVGRYVVESALGAGGMGVVSLARDPELRRPVVIKLVHPNMGLGEGGDELEARLRREAQAMAQVSHTNVVQIFDIGRRGDRVFLAMEFIAGRTLDVWLLEKPRSQDDILGVFRQAGAGLAAAHRAGLVHRDFKPSNVLVGNDEVVKVTDFGLARSFSGAAAGGAGGAGATRKLRVPQGEPVRGDGPTFASPYPGGAPFAAAPRPSGVHAVLTEVNSVVGTPAYMAPEQASGGAIDARTDQYALAVTLLDALLGQSPSRRVTAPGDPPPAIDAALERARVAPPIRAAILRALAPDPAARFPAIDEFLRALAPPAAPPRRSRRTALVLVGIALCGLGAGAWLYAKRREPPACSPSAPGRWAGDPRARTLAALGAVPRPFAGWDAERMAAAIDRAVDALGAAEVARCQGAPLAGPAGTAECIARRTTALTAAVAALSSSPPPEGPWELIRPIEACDAPVAPGSAALRRELRTAAPARARAIADAARKAGDDRLAADAHEVAGLAALSAGDATTAEADLLAMRAAGERAGDDAIRGRALLHMLETARGRGEHAAARRDSDELSAMLARHGNAPRDQLTVALVEASAFTGLGDVAAAFAAWDRAQGAAKQLADRDAALTAALGRAWSTHVLRFDLPAARAEATTALTGGTSASPAARAAALAIAADLAIAAGDGSAALAALDEAHRLDAARARLSPDRLRRSRARALGGDVDAILDGLVPDSDGDPLTAARIEIARGQILLAAGRRGEARDVLEKVEREVRGHGKNAAAVAMPVPERIDLELAICDLQVATADRCKQGYQLDPLLKGLHPRAPARARFAIAQAGSDAVRQFPLLRSQYLMTAIDLLVDGGAAPVAIAELRWQVAQIGAGGADHRRLATAAREAFQAAGRTAEVAEIDRWLGPDPDGDAVRPAADAAGPPSTDPPRPRDPWGPQP